jgi:hypothetical protein
LPTSLWAQSTGTGQGNRLQYSVNDPEHSFPPCAAGVTMDLFFTPWFPHGALQAPKSLLQENPVKKTKFKSKNQTYIWQSTGTGQGPFVHDSLKCGHEFPLFAGCCVMERVRIPYICSRLDKTNIENKLSYGTAFCSTRRPIWDFTVNFGTRHSPT